MIEVIEKVNKSYNKLKDEMSKIIVGQEDVVKLLLISLMTKGHCLIVGVPGLAKTLMVSTMSRCLGLDFKRIQFTPDLMPSDITGSEIIEEDTKKGRYYKFIKGPVFSNIILADEINRTPPKTQAALLQAMQEHIVTANGIDHKLDEPFLVLATQNPIEQEGTYPLPEAQLDRFIFQVDISYPSRKEEIDIVSNTTSAYDYMVKPVLTKEDILEIQKIIREVPASDEYIELDIDIVRATRPETGNSVAKKWLSYGAGPRASQNIILAAKANAILSGRYAITREDISYCVAPVLKHRIISNFNAEAEGISKENIIKEILDSL
ncbi:MAG: AAA family ATPase [Candidatus Muiribacterium halophilum]|uniref:AAA family ATPase n=1 Tax=Muiribacterium halophilum TaxID=2053465 RepID=A0A2N5ZK65_MUIH1|nr:MAG: AAA family ATPase [Candidatus Muirbacterium halophilum]